VSMAEAVRGAVVSRIQFLDASFLTTLVAYIRVGRGGAAQALWQGNGF
jgi:hypothetical protein